MADRGNDVRRVFEAISCPVNGRCVTASDVEKASAATPVVTTIAGYCNGRVWKYGPMRPAAAALAAAEQDSYPERVRGCRDPRSHAPVRDDGPLLGREDLPA